jgi:hypothetical protein
MIIPLRCPVEKIISETIISENEEISLSYNETYYHRCFPPVFI